MQYLRATTRRCWPRKAQPGCQGPANIPEGKDAKARAIYQRIEARKVALKNYLLELRKPD